MKQRLDLLELLERILELAPVKFVLASLIVLSVLPLSQTRTLDLVVFPVFLVEIVARLAIFRRNGTLHRWEAVALVADGLALLSFLPLDSAVDTRVLRLIRLARLVILGRFLRLLAADLRRIVTQRQIRYQLGFLLTTVLLLTFLGGTILATFEIPIEDFDEDGRLDRGSLSQVLWWVFRQIEDPGNLVEDADRAPLLLVMSLVLTIAGVFVMSFIIGIGTSVVGALMQAGHHRPINIKDHTAVVGGGRNVREVLRDLVQLYGKNRRRVRVVVLDQPPEPPAYLEEPLFRGVEYRCGEPTSLDAHTIVCTARARRVIVLNDDEKGESADAYAISAVIAARQKNPSCPIIVELRHRRNADVARVAGGHSVNPIPMGRFLGSLMAQNIMFPGIDLVFEELLTARGSEIYTHIYSPSELETLRGFPAERSVDFLDLLVEGYRRHHVIPLGVLLSRGAWTHDMGQLTFWLNPLEDPQQAAAELGATRGRIPLTSLRGLVAIGVEYSAVRRAAEALLSGQIETSRRIPEPASTARPGMHVQLCSDMLELRRILVLGDNELLPAMIENTNEFVRGVEFIVVVPAHRQSLLENELRRRTHQLLAPGEDHVLSLPGGGKVRLLPSTWDMLSDALENPLTNERPLDAAVLLADPHEEDPDAHSALMLLRLLELVRDQQLHVSPRFRVIAQVLSGPKGALLEQRLGQSSPAPVRVIPTQQMRAYFLVHSAYVPGSDSVHFELLSPLGQDFCQLSLQPDGDGAQHDQELSFPDLLEALARQHPSVICFGLRLAAHHRHAGVWLNPSPSDEHVRFRISDVEALYAVGETVQFLASSQKGEARPSSPAASHR